MVSSDLSLELRKLGPTHVEKLGAILNTQNDWKNLMKHVPKIHTADGKDREPKRFKLDDIA